MIDHDFSCFLFFFFSFYIYFHAHTTFSLPKKKYKNSKSTCENNIKNDKNVYQIHHYARVFIKKKK